MKCPFTLIPLPVFTYLTNSAKPWLMRLGGRAVSIWVSRSVAPEFQVQLKQMARGETLVTAIEFTLDLIGEEII